MGKRDIESTSGEVPASETKKLNASFAKEDIKQFFNSKIWSDAFQNELQQSVSKSEPYRWGTITELMDDTLLRQVRKEVLSEIAFTKKETDIYKVFQLGDLANLSGLNWDDLSRLPSLYKLRSAIYSEQFRDAISKITGCGKLSGVKTDMSINTYNKGCHLLTHDDVIGSRRVSFILYLPEPDKTWKPQYGGALRLFPSIVPNVPHTDFHSKLVPQFNQIAFFTVQPGLSFHDVEEVRVDRQRLSIQGWFHIPQPGEDGYIEGEQAETEARSTLQQLQSKELQDFDFPKPTKEDIADVSEQEEEFSGELDAETLKYLAKYINPLYLHKENLEKLNVQFGEESIVEINNILNEQYAEVLRELLKKEELEKEQPKTAAEISTPWKCAIPPHKQRYMYIDGKELQFSMDDESIQKANKLTEKPNFSNPNLYRAEDADNKLLEVAAILASSQFRKWLRVVTDLIATSEQILVRRFRPGQDFILATTTEKQIARNDEELNIFLEATLNLTPTAINKKNWESGEFGGYELCMASNSNDSDDEGEDEEDDPAIYKASNPNDDSVLYTSHCKWNTLCLMLRDPTVLKFVKYVSINAKGSRWDVSCQWNVKDGDDEEEEDENGDKE